MRRGPGGRIYARPGSAGFHIEELQSALSSASGVAFSMPGAFCTRTQHELRAWQRAQRLPQTGDLDRGTCQVLWGLDAPPLRDRVHSVAAWVMGLGELGVTVDGPLGLRWGYFGLSTRSGRLQEAMASLSQPRPELVTRVEALPVEHQVAFWLSHRREDGQVSSPGLVTWLPRVPEPHVLSVQRELVDALWVGLPEQVPVASEEVEVAQAFLERVFVDAFVPEWKAWKLGEGKRLREQLNDLSRELAVGRVLGRRPDGRFSPEGATLESFGIG